MSALYDIYLLVCIVIRTSYVLARFSHLLSYRIGISNISIGLHRMYRYASYSYISIYQTSSINYETFVDMVYLMTWFVSTKQFTTRIYTIGCYIQQFTFAFIRQLYNSNILLSMGVLQQYHFFLTKLSFHGEHKYIAVQIKEMLILA